MLDGIACVELTQLELARARGDSRNLETKMATNDTQEQASEALRPRARANGASARSSAVANPARGVSRPAVEGTIDRWLVEGTEPMFVDVAAFSSHLAIVEAGRVTASEARTPTAAESLALRSARAGALTAPIAGALH